MANPPEQPKRIREKPLHCGYSGPGIVLPLEQRMRRGKYRPIDEPTVPRAYWYWTAGLVSAALVLGLLAGRFLLG
jgi:hypothetical protein